jgi:hypothetical protein
VQLDQRTAAPPLHGVEPSGRDKSSNHRAKLKKWLFSEVFFRARIAKQNARVKISDTFS